MCVSVSVYVWVKEIEGGTEEGREGEKGAGGGMRTMSHIASGMRNLGLQSPCDPEYSLTTEPSTRYGCVALVRFESPCGCLDTVTAAGLAADRNSR